ncbi:MAG: hypothetical protein Q8882_07275, partial [Bacillota bacterium]|nr:hypothetical protein [Bacillota bacterium]
MMEQSSWSEKDPEFTEGDKTILKDYLEVTKLEGILTSTFYQDGFDDKKDKNVTIEVTKVDNEKVEVALRGIAPKGSFDYKIDAKDTGAENYLGYSVVAYVTKYGEGDDELVAIAPKTGKNNTLTVNFEDIAETTANSGVKMENPYDNITFEYYVGDEVEPKTAKIYNKEDRTAGLVLNDNNLNEYDKAGIPRARVIAMILVAMGHAEISGVTTFIDNDNDGVYDFIKVEAERDEIVADEVNAKTYKVLDKRTGASCVFDPTEEDRYVEFYKDGKEASFGDIKEDDVLTIVSNDIDDDSSLKDAQHVKVYISSDKVKGYVKTASEDKNEYKIGDKVYEKSGLFRDDIELGSEGTFYLNYRGSVAYSDVTSEAGGRYAYLLEVNYEDTFASGKTVTLRFMNEKGEWIDAPIYEKATFIYYDENGEQVANKLKETDLDLIGSYTNGWLAAEHQDDKATGMTLGTAATSNRLFQYTLNSDGAITKIVLPSAGLTEDHFSGEAFGASEYVKDTNKFKSAPKRGGVDKNTVVFVVDPDANGTPTLKKEVSFDDYTMFLDDSYYAGSAYDYKDGTYGCMVVNTDVNEIADETPYFVVESAQLTSETDKDDYYTFTGWMNGELVTLQSVDTADFEFANQDNSEGVKVAENCQKGDILRFAKNAAGKVTKASVLFETASAIAPAPYIDKSADEKCIALYGYISSDKASGTSKAIELSDYVNGDVLWDSIATAGSLMKGKIYVVDLTGSKTTIETVDSIADYLGSADAAYDADNNGDTVYYAHATVVDDETVDIVVYAVRQSSKMYYSPTVTGLK